MASASARPGPGSSAKAAAERHAGISVLIDLAAVILGPLALVGKQVVGLGHLRETFRGLGIVLVPIGVQLLRKAAIGLLDFGLACSAIDAQLLIQVHSVPFCRS